jgi:hypothetical protein
MARDVCGVGSASSLAHPVEACRSYLPDVGPGYPALSALLLMVDHITF